jgi:hypothetical protein
MVVMNYSLVILKHFDYFRITILQPINSYLHLCYRRYLTFASAVGLLLREGIIRAIVSASALT